MPAAAPAIVWFREDLRLADNPALRAGIDSGRPLVCVYIFDERSRGLRAPGGASRWWLHHSLEALGGALEKHGGRLDIFSGAAGDVLEHLVDQTKAGALYWNRRYDRAGIGVDKSIKEKLGETLEVESFNGKLIAEPWTIKTKTGGPFRVFTPFWRALLASGAPPAPLPAPRRIHGAKKPPDTIALEDLKLLPTGPDWAGGLREAWTPGEAEAAKTLTHFLDHALADYPEGRDRPDRDFTSRLSPHLAFGEISPRQIWLAARHAADSNNKLARGADKFLSEIAWREFSYHLLFYNPDLATKNFDARFDAFDWPRRHPAHFEAWARGRTGYPIVDAGMRELWATGYMHNRVRMIAASFLIKHLMIDWRAGEEWFWDTLCDADPANNAASWQWVAGSGADAAPYFRIFNPVLQGEKFDPKGEYVRKWAPELKDVPDKFIHRPWDAPTPPQSYPPPIVDHAMARARALAAFEKLKG
ncbi:MAG: deoxyribodipyrimidine photo-lyase [Hyphomicrobiales bacterium]|nr:deoxyribodipyrimidine photo-lyase [Hyphomicrobiales bacterium]